MGAAQVAREPNLRVKLVGTPQRSIGCIRGSIIHLVTTIRTMISSLEPGSGVIAEFFSTMVLIFEERKWTPASISDTGECRTIGEIEENGPRRFGRVFLWASYPQPDDLGIKYVRKCKTPYESDGDR